MAYHHLSVFFVLSLFWVLLLCTELVPMQVLVGLRNGTMLQLTASSEVTVTAAAQTPQLRLPLPQLQLTAIKELGSLPVVLVPLPTAVGLVGASLALSDRMALVSSAPGTGRAVASPLAVAGVTHAVPLWQPASSLSGNSNSRQDLLLVLLFLACAMRICLALWNQLCLYDLKTQPVMLLFSARHALLASLRLCVHVPPTMCACPCIICVPAIDMTCCMLHATCCMRYADLPRKPAAPLQNVLFVSVTAAHPIMLCEVVTLLLRVWSFSCSVIISCSSHALWLQVHSAVCFLNWKAAASRSAASGAPPHAHPTPATPRPPRPLGCPPP